MTKGKTDARRVTVAEHAGFCFGVRRATDTLERLLQERTGGTRIVTLGALIHNDVYNARMAARGVATVEQEDTAALERLIAGATPAAPVILLVRAHGIPRGIRQRLEAASRENPCFSFVDCTCPYVARIHEIVSTHDVPGRQLWVFGTPEHPEVQGILSCFSGPGRVFATAEQLSAAISGGNVADICQNTPIVVAQTTYFLSEWLKCQEIIKKLCTNALIFDTICNVTDLRQSEARMLSRKNDLMIVVGGKQSSNTQKLALMCRSVGTPTLTVETASELDVRILEPYKNVGIVAGASTPSDVIEEVYKTMSEMENFETLLDSSFKTLNTGDVVTGIVEQVSDTEIQLDLGTSVTGYIKAEQITDDPSAKLTTLYKKGDEIEAFVIRVSDVEGVAELSKKRVDSDKNWKHIEDAAETHEVLEGKVVDVVKGGVRVLCNANRVFIPASHTGVPKEGDLNVLIGTTVKFRVMKIEPGKKAIGSIRSVLRDERIAKEAEFWATIEEGKIYNGVVKSMTTYGAFVDLGGVDGMVHVSELSWKRIKTPADVIAIGDEITVFVKSFDAEKKKISLGYKTEATNPWNIFTSQYAVGDVATVTIVNLTTYGAFASIVNGVDGLIHVSQIAQTRVEKPADVLSVGQTVDVRILEIDNEKQKVSLSIRALLDEAQAEAEAMPEETFEAEEEVVEE